MTDIANQARPKPLPFRGGVGVGTSGLLPHSKVEQGRESPPQTPPLKGKGLRAADYDKRMGSTPSMGRAKNWNIPAGHLAELHARAKEMRRNPTEPEKRLWRHLSNSQLDGAKFRRQEVIGWSIADFACPSANLIVEVDGDTHDDPAKDQRRDAKLAEFGYRVIHVTNADVTHNMEGVLTLISEALRVAESPHPNPSPEGEGLKEGISLEGSME
jgi:very-short-patch-repair endonuclease